MTRRALWGMLLAALLSQSTLAAETGSSRPVPSYRGLQATGPDLRGSHRTQKWSVLWRLDRQSTRLDSEPLCARRKFDLVILSEGGLEALMSG